MDQNTLQLQTIADQNPEDGEAQFELGRALLHEQEFGQAVSALEKAVRLEPSQPAWLYFLASAYGMNRQLPESVEAWQEYLAHFPDHADAYAKFGIILAKVKHFEDSIQMLTAAVKLEPENAFYHYFLGLSYQETENYNEALRCFSESITYHPDFADAHYWQGIMFAFLSHDEAAIESLRHCVEINPEHMDAQYNLCVAYARAGRASEARLQYELVARMDPETGKDLHDRIFETGK